MTKEKTKDVSVKTTATMEIGTNAKTKFRKPRNRKVIKNGNLLESVTADGKFTLIELNPGLGAVVTTKEEIAANSVSKEKESAGYVLDEAATTKYYDATIDICMAAKTVAYNITEKTIEGGKAALVQRGFNAERSHEFASFIVNDETKTRVGGDSTNVKKYGNKNLPLVLYFNIRNENLIIRYRGKLYLMFPSDDNTIKYYAKDIEIFDGQHRAMAFSDGFRRIKCSAYMVKAIFYVGASKALMLDIFYNLNFESKHIGCDFGYSCLYQMGELRKYDHMLYELLQHLNTSYVDDGKMKTKSVIEGLVNFGDTTYDHSKHKTYKHGHISCKTIAQHSCLRYKNEEDCLIAMLESIGCKDISSMANKINLYLKACNAEHEQIHEEGGNIFAPISKKHNTVGTKQQRGALMFAFATPIIKMIKRKNMKYTYENVAGLVNILLKDVIVDQVKDASCFDSKGQGDSKRKFEDLVNDFETICNNMDAKSIRERSLSCLKGKVR